jgi:glutamate-ammonia-ligase adenylyltransferase
MLALSIASFARYQADEAESWEHMALTRARVVGESSRAHETGPGEAVDAAITAALVRPRDAEVLRRAVLEMRADIAAAKRPKGVYDVKLAPGGLVDLEFLVHYLQLRDGLGIGPDLGSVIAVLTAAGKLPDGLVAAHDVLTRFLVLLRLVATGAAVPPGFTPAVEAMLARGMGAASFQAVTEQLALAKAAVRLAFQTVLAQSSSATKGN